MPDLFRFEIDPPLDLIFEGLSAQVGDLEDVLNEVGTTFYEDVLPSFIEDLKTKPGKAITMTPDEWTSPAQYKAHLYTRNWGWGIPYRRDDKGTSESWEGSVSTSANSLEIRVENTDPDAKYVFGGFDDDSGKPQQSFHRKTGWRLARPLVIDFFLQSARDIAPHLYTSWWKREKA